MTATAPGRVLRCDYAACDRPATVEVDAWAYCDQHAGRARTETPPVTPAPRPPATVTPMRPRPDARAATIAAHPASRSKPAGACEQPGPRSRRVISSAARGHEAGADEGGADAGRQERADVVGVGLWVGAA